MTTYTVAELGACPGTRIVAKHSTLGLGIRFLEPLVGRRRIHIKTVLPVPFCTLSGSGWLSTRSAVTMGVTVGPLRSAQTNETSTTGRIQQSTRRSFLQFGLVVSRDSTQSPGQHSLPKSPSDGVASAMSSPLAPHATVARTEWRCCLQ